MTLTDIPGVLRHPVAIPPTAARAPLPCLQSPLGRCGGVVRRVLWRSALALTGGLRVTGTLPDGPVVVVANHSSHADTAALLAALPGRRRPVVAAAVDYWFASRWRRLIVTSLVAALPVARGQKGAYAALREAATPVLGRGDIVVIYPEGTRSAGGSVAAFHSGAVRLARDAGVPVVPVSLVGTAGLLPKHGRLHPRAVEVRIGAAVAPNRLQALSDETACTMLRERIVSMGEPPRVEPMTSPVWRFVARRAATPMLLLLSFGWGVGEALSWPVLAEMYLVFWVAAVPRRVLPAALALWAGSVLGVVIHALLAGHGVALPMPLTTQPMAAVAAHDLRDGPVGMLHQMLDGIPVKVYAAQAGHAHISLLALAGWTALTRGIRILAVAVFVTGVARVTQPLLRRFYGSYLLVVGTAFAYALHETVGHWR